MSHKTAATVAHTIGIDTGKNTLHLIGLDDRGAIVLREKIARGRIAARFANVPRCLIGIEAGMATHYVARELIALGHDVRQVPPAYAKPFRQGHKNDFRDAHAIAEAASEQQPVHLDHRLLGISPRTVRVLFGWKVGFEDRLQHQHRCCHADPIPHGRDAQRPELAVGLRYKHSSDRILLSAPYQSMRLAVRAKVVSKVTLGLFGPLRDHGQSAKSS